MLRFPFGRKGFFAILFFALAVASVLPEKLLAQTACNNCLAAIVDNGSGQGTVIRNNTGLGNPASSGGAFATINQTTSTAPNLPPGQYPAWCASSPADPLPGSSTVLSWTSTSSFNLPDGSLWNKINYILNHKQGMVFEVQNAIWGLRGTNQTPLSVASQAMVDAANTLGANYVPGPGDIIAIYLDNPAGVQDLLLELKNTCAMLGDYVWKDSNGDGVQQPGEVGLNGVQVELKDAGGATIATTLTGPAPSTNSPGYYQFSSICPGQYTVAVNVSQPPLTGYTPAPTLQGDTSQDSNLNPAPVSLPNSGNDQTSDFGFVPPPPLNVTCALNPGTSNVFYHATVTATGGVPPYTFAVTGGSLPNGLTLVQGGEISGIPTVVEIFNFTVTATDSFAGQAMTGFAACTIEIKPQLGSLDAIVYNDANGSHNPAGQAGIPGWTVNVTGPNSYTATTSTSGNGTIATITGLAPGNYTVCTVPQSGWMQTTPAPLNNCQTVTVPAGGNARAELGYIQLGSLNAIVYTDANGSHNPAGQAGLAGWTVNITGPGGYTATSSTAVNGTIATITGLTPGSYTVCTVPQSGWTQTTPAPLNNCQTVTVPANGLGHAELGYVQPPPPVCTPGKFDFTGGNSSTNGPGGNIRTFTASNGVKVKVSAFSKSKYGAWASAYLGSYPPGLGVTNNSESASDPGHRVDNKSGVDYVLFEFSQPVLVTRAFLDYIGDDGDVSVWIGTKTDPFNNHLTLSDSVLASIGTSEENLQDNHVSSRWADFNAAGVYGNVLVISAWTGDEDPEDEFKIAKLEMLCATPPPVCSGAIGDFVWKDVNGNGIQDSGEPGIAGVTVQLKNGSTVIATTTTDSNGRYKFTGVCSGTYTVVIPVVPSGYTATANASGGDRSVDSNGSPATVTLSTSNSSDLSIDFGFVPVPAPVCAPGTFNLTGGRSSTTGDSGNIRTFTASNGVKVKISVFSRSSSGTWSKAYLGFYSPGLGVTNNSEDGSDPGHRVDNRGSQKDYVLFEFSSPVVVDRAFLDYIGADSDISVWIGTKTDPFNDHISLSDSMLSSLGLNEDNKSSASGSRWADFNAGNISGNVLVIAAIDNGDGDDEFKLAKLDVICPQPPPACNGTIGDLVWKDVNRNGIQDTGEPGLSGVTVQLKNGSTVVATTTTSSNGFYQFTGLCAGAYTVVVPTAPANYAASPSAVGSNRSVDSNGSPATVTLAGNNSTDSSIDFGFTPPPQQPPVCAPVTFSMTGNSSADGSNGNIRTFTGSNGVQVKVSAFSRSSGGSWSTAYLGAYGSGLGVTDSSEGDGVNNRHKVDNIGGQVNYVLFEFSAPVAINHVLLEAIGADSDISVWLGTKDNPFTNHLTLSDSILSSLGPVEENLQDDNADSCVAQINSDSSMGNVLVIAAQAADTSPEDEFKISQLIADCVETGGYVTYTQGGWGAPPNGNNPGALLQNKFSMVYHGDDLQIGGYKKLTFTSASAIKSFLPQGGSPGKLTSNDTNPLDSSAGVLAGQVLALQLNVDFSNKGLLPSGLSSLKVAAGNLAGQTVDQVLALANSVLGGGSLPPGLSYSELNDVLDSINNNFDGGEVNRGFLKK